MAAAVTMGLVLGFGVAWGVYHEHWFESRPGHINAAGVEVQAFHLAPGDPLDTSCSRITRFHPNRWYCAISYGGMCPVQRLYLRTSGLKVSSHRWEYDGTPSHGRCPPKRLFAQS
jgi:hypothetical protein